MIRPFSCPVAEVPGFNHGNKKIGPLTHAFFRSKTCAYRFFFRSQE
jgi:hypothetical protein